MAPCAQCGTEFSISREERALHAKITSTFEAGAFPLPSLCIDCRFLRKMIWRNERNLYRRTCDGTGESILSVYPEKAPFPVYRRSFWWSDAWDALSYGRSFDFGRPFFEQFADLLRVSPRQALNLQNSENCDYCNFAFDARDCYLSQCIYRSEGMLYSYWMLDCKDCIDCSNCMETQRCVGCSECNHSYGCSASALCHTCAECAYCYDCRGCTSCFGCVGLRRKQYCLFNEQLSKDDYGKRRAEMDLSDLSHMEAIRKRIAVLKADHPHLFSVQEKTENCTGDYIFESKDCRNCFQVYRSQDCINVQDAETKDALDCYHPGWSSFTYETYSSVTQTSSAFDVQCWTGSDTFYSDNCQSCSHCFGCVSLRHKQYCILNTQYTEEEYRALLPRIRSYMEKTPLRSSDGSFAGQEWGLFFPMELSPFAYNETMAQQYFPRSREDIERLGWRWAEDPAATTGKETIAWENVAPHTKDVSDDITNAILACTACGRNYRIIAKELAQYRSSDLPLPRTCPDCRFAERFTLRNPRKLYERSCSACGKELQTSYAPSQTEKIVCEECYLKAVY